MIRCYTTQHEISRTVMAAFSEGCEGQLVPPVALLDGEAAMYGILRGTGEILKTCEMVGRPYHYLDHGYIGHSHYDGYYRVSLNGRQAQIDLSEKWPAERLKKLNIKTKPWRKNGSKILVIPLTQPLGQFYGINPEQWLGSVTREVSRHTRRQITTKAKEDGDILEALENVWCVVTHSSNAAVDALIEGVPVITLGESIAQPMSWAYADIEKPFWPDRESWLRGVACNQWTLPELRGGAYMRFYEGRSKEAQRAVA